MSEISYSEAISFLMPRHYSGRKPQIKYAFGLYEENKLVAVCTYGVPASRPLCVGVMGKKYFDKVIELNRLCRLDDCNTKLSEFVGFTLRELKKFNLLIVSYADTQMGHFGSLYQACNFIYTGATKQRTDKYTEGNKHSRHYNDDNNHLRKVRSAKHRYIYYACDRRAKRVYEANMNYKTEPYPKGDKKNYVLGEFLEPLIIDSSDKLKAKLNELK